jgi:hypothetical protein
MLPTILTERLETFVKSDRAKIDAAIKKIGELMQANDRSLRAHLSNLKIALESLKKPGIEMKRRPSQTALLGMGKLVKAAFIPKADNSGVMLDHKATLENLKDIPEVERQWEVNAMERLLSSRVGDDLLMSQALPPDLALAKRYPGLSLKDALKTAGLAVQKDAMELKTGPYAKDALKDTGSRSYLNDQTINLAASGADLSSAEMTRFVEVQGMVNLIKDWYTPKELGGQTSIPADPYPISVRENLKRMNTEEKLNSYLTSLNNQPKFKKAWFATAQNCLTNFQEQMATAPSAADVESARETAAWARERVNAVLKPALSEQSMRIISGEIRNSLFEFPKTAEEFQRFFNEAVDIEIAGYNDSARDAIDSRSMPDFEEKNLGDLEALGAAEFLKFESYFEFANLFCKRFSLDGHRDMAYTAHNKILTSWLSVAKPEIGRGVMAHELGHRVSSTIRKMKVSEHSRKKFEDYRNCLGAKHASENPTPLDRFTEEDWADLVAAKATSQQKMPTLCQFLARDKGEYVNLDLLQTSNEETHSSNLFRIIHSQVVQHDSLPGGCKQLLEGKRPPVEFKACY